MKNYPKQKYLKEIFSIQEVLKKNGYFDTQRIAREIIEYCEENNISPTEVLERIESSEPWEYIRGKVEFKGVDFFVNRNTLIPRVETEQLVDIAIDFLNKNKNVKTVLDVGTGSGCIIIFLAKNLCKKNNITFLGSDVNSKGLSVAKKNSALHKVNRKVSFLKENLINTLDVKSPFLITANLPYIPTHMYYELEKSVIDFEPRVALDGGKDGLKYYKQLLKQIKTKGLEKKKGALLLEIEPSTLEDFKKLLANKNHEIIKDYRGLNRFVLIHFG